MEGCGRAEKRSSPSKAIAWVRMLRLHISLIFPAIGLAGFLISSKPSSLAFAIVPVTSIFMLSAAAYMLNDVFDLEVDRISNPDRPLPTGMLSVREVMIVGGSLVVVGASLTFVYGCFASILMALAMSALVFAYSAPPVRLRRFYLAPYLTIAFFATISFLLASSYRSGVLGPRFVLGSLLIFGYSSGSCMVKEFKDIEGDSRMGVRSIPVALGLQTAVRVTIPIYLASCLLLLPFYWLFELSPLFFLFFGAAFLAKSKTSYDLMKNPLDMGRRMRILGVEVVSTILLFLGIAASALV